MVSVLRKNAREDRYEADGTSPCWMPCGWARSSFSHQKKSVRRSGLCLALCAVLHQFFVCA